VTVTAGSRTAATSDLLGHRPIAPATNINRKFHPQEGDAMGDQPDRILGDGAKGDLDHPERGVPAGPAAPAIINQDNTTAGAGDGPADEPQAPKE
jgi:hypothetical protein